MVPPDVNHLTPLSVSLILSIMENDSTLTKIVIFRKKRAKNFIICEKNSTFASLYVCPDTKKLTFKCLGSLIRQDETIKNSEKYYKPFE